MARLQQLRQGSDATAAALAATQKEIVALGQEDGGGGDGPQLAIKIESTAWLARLRGLRNILTQRPELGIPELNLLSDREWLLAAKDAQLDTPENVRKSLAELRGLAKGKFTGYLSIALRKFLAASGGQLPLTVDGLAPYFDEPVAPAIFPRYELLRTGSVNDLPDKRVTVIREKTSVDEDYDGRYGVDANAVRKGGGNDARAWIDDPDGYDGMIRRAQADYARANNGAKAAGVEQLAPYIYPPLSPAKLQKLVELERELKR